MHEAGLMQEALDLATAAAQRAGASRVHRLALRVGTLSGVVPEALQAAFAALAPGSAAEGAQLDIELIPAIGWCPHCSAEFIVAGGTPLTDTRCPTCGHAPDPLRRGLELELGSMEVS
jgi:hydrogenase nickel incorporation protein HypA/HybF